MKIQKVTDQLSRLFEAKSKYRQLIKELDSLMKQSALECDADTLHSELASVTAQILQTKFEFDAIGLRIQKILEEHYTKVAYIEYDGAICRFFSGDITSDTKWSALRQKRGFLAKKREWYLHMDRCWMKLVRGEEVINDYNED